jgi:Circadian oscillating protein COP23
MHSLFINLSRTFLLARLLFVTVLILPTQSIAASKDSVGFDCHYSKTAPATRLYMPGDRFYDIVSWRRYGKQAGAKCREVSRRFDDMYRKGNLEVLRVRRSTKSGVWTVCGFSTNPDPNDLPCYEKNKIFDLLPGSKPEEELENLLSAMKNNSGPINQSSDNEIIIDFRKLIDKLNSR